MRFRTASAIFLGGFVAVACEPAPQPPPNEMDAVVPGTRVDPAAPPGALGQEDVNVAEGNITPAEQGDFRDVEQRTPVEVVELYANMLEQGRFADAYRLWDPQATPVSQDEFVQKFDELETINAAVGRMGPAGSLQDDVQLTLTGKTSAGENYSLTGPVTVKRASDAPGATNDQRRWRITRMVLTSKPAVANAIVD